jgi:hypothetical protein
MNRVAAPLLAFVLVALTGCAPLLTMGAGPAFSALQVLIVRSVEQTVPADLDATWATTLTTLETMGLALDQVDREGDTWRIRARSASAEVSIEATSVSPRLTRVSARVERGTVSADKETATTLLAEIDRALKPAPVDVARGADTRADIAALADEITRLRGIVDTARAAAPVAPAAAPSPAPSPRVQDAIFSVPASYGVPTLAAAPAPVAPVPAPRSAPAVVAPALELRARPVALDPRADSLRPVGILMPVAPLGDASPTR